MRSIRELRGTPVIVVQHAAQKVTPLDRTIPLRSCPEWYWTTLIDALMRSSMVVIVRVGHQYPSKMLLPEDQDLVQTLFSG